MNMDEMNMDKFDTQYAVNRERSALLAAIDNKSDADQEMRDAERVLLAAVRSFEGAVRVHERASVETDG